MTISIIVKQFLFSNNITIFLIIIVSKLNIITIFGVLHRFLQTKASTLNKLLIEQKDST